MSATEISQLKNLAEKLNALHGTSQVQPDANDIYTPAHQRAYERLQSALFDFEKDPMNQDKSRSMMHAIETYQTANEMMFLKVENFADQLDEADDEITYQDIFKQYM